MYLETARKLDFVTAEVSHRLKKLLAEEKEDLTVVQFFTLRLLAREERLKVTDIAGCLGVTLSAITGLINRLYKLGLVTRDQDEADRRVVWIKLTPKGRELIDELNEKRAEKLAVLLREMPEEDFRKFEELLLFISEKLG
ncbi:MAG: MarR family transcriptional regulator [Clostridia bacterium]|nr:MarR family transcriptional regulator [Clostridia bacterium]